MRESKQEDEGTNMLKPRRDSQARRTSLAELIPDWPVLTKKKRAVKVNKYTLEFEFSVRLTQLTLLNIINRQQQKILVEYILIFNL